MVPTCFYELPRFFELSLMFGFEGHLCCFQFLDITNSAAMNIVQQMSLLYECASFGYIPKSGIAGPFRELETDSSL
ncbi:Protein of unknown function DUF3704 containing protein [Cricetulus griseus]|uniref:Uncharacterized protein n=1 Tax=Cricetulus griseus TaxID=10029 RepID=A0A061HWB4_CRIGR|nr:Protein of unknown function DUF3704 containing protein [Cricetulus griseus]